jgi:DNA repair exonuclease SbcCD ATPase subunit
MLQIKTSDFTGGDPRQGYILRLFRFRKIKNLEITLPPDGIILLDGRSGIGKTSILEAISFVLHDDAGNTCYPRDERSSKKKHDSTWVQLIFPNGLTISRQRRPNLLCVQDKDVNLMDDSAQCYINRIMGSFSNWLVGGYIRQGELCGFFSMSSDEKLDLLQQIETFDEESGTMVNGEMFTKRFNTNTGHISVTTKRLQEIDIQVKVHSEMYLRLYNQCTEEVRSSRLWTPEEISDLLKKYQVSTFNELLPKVRNDCYSKCQLIRSEISKAQIQVAKNKENKKQRIRLEDLLKKNEDELIIFVNDNPESIDQYEKELIDVNEQISLAKRTERRCRLLTIKTDIQRRLDLIPDEISKYTWSDLDKFDKILSGLTLEQIDEQLKEIVVAKDYQQKLVMYQRYQNALTQMNNYQQQLESYPKESVRDQIDDITKKMLMLTLQQKKLTCPKCSASLQLNDGKLDCMDVVLEDIEGISLNELNIQKSKYQQIESRYQQRDHVEKSLISAQEQLLSLNSVDLPSKPKLADFPNLDSYIPPLIEAKKGRESLPINIEYERKKLTSAQERARLIRDIEPITKELNSLACGENQLIEVKSLEAKRSEITLKLNELRSQATKRSSLLATKGQLLDQLKNYPRKGINKLEKKIEKFQSELDAIVKESEKFEKDINTQIQLNQLVEIYKQHQNCQVNQQELTRELMAFQKIKASLITAEYIRLDTILNGINKTIAKILNILFSETISVTIHSLRQLKTDDRIKPQINCQIIYDGSECSKISELSGGEKIRVSIALAVAFSRYSNVPFLLLDESLSTLDAVTKELTIKILRKRLHKKLIVTVNHDTTAGVYDSVMQLS